MIDSAEVLEAARQNRDPRFDGRFFVGVLTTGIYCRPICPVRIPRRENVKIFSSAAAAAGAGFRPCLRCRPEAAPGTPAWLGSSFTVSRALQMMALDGGSGPGMDTVAAELNISTRQLCRLFRKHLGTTPSLILQTRRLHFSKQLLDETSLPISEVCFAAGFGSVRRFNDVIKKTYGRTPRQLRQRVEPIADQAGSIGFNLEYRPPFDWSAMLEFFAKRGIPGVEWVGPDCYRRTFRLHGTPGSYSLKFTRNGPGAQLYVQFPDTTRLLEIVARIRQQFDLDADSASIESLLATDPLLSGPVTARPGLRVPGCWDGLEIAVRAIVGQQVSVKSAATLMRRLVERTGSTLPGAKRGDGNSLYLVFPEPGALADADLSGLGITGQRITAIKSLAGKVAAGSLSLDSWQDPADFRRQICQIRGIGEWTAQYVALRALRDPDAFPAGDLILRRSVAHQAGILSPRALLTLSQRWRPWRAYAVMQLWRQYQWQQQQDNLKPSPRSRQPGQSSEQRHQSNRAWHG